VKIVSGREQITSVSRYIYRVERDAFIISTNTPPLDAGERILAALQASVLAAEKALADAHIASMRREAIRLTRRELKKARALAPLVRNTTSGLLVDGTLEFASKANQLLGPLRDRDALIRSIQRISERFTDGEPRRVTRTVLLATLVFAESDRRDEDHYSEGAIARARRSVRAAVECVTSIKHDAQLDARAARAALLWNFDSCRRELREALDEDDLVRLHECRKKASSFALVLSVFGAELASPLVRARSRARALASALGEDRDFALLDVEMRAARAQLAGSPLISAIDETLRLARLESNARMEDSARAYLRVSRSRVHRAMEALFD
jgi:hypothetical protein